MSGWPGKTVIGLTGNIATGKSVVRKMLEHLGAYGIDADALAHRTFAPTAPGYQPVVDAFGEGILAADGRVDRARLGAVVFQDPDALRKLEAIVHPLVRLATHNLIRRVPHCVVVIEAIKLLESSMRAGCDSLWVTDAPHAIQTQRLQTQRGMSLALAEQRIAAQGSQEAKLAAADVIIRNDSGLEQAWQQVYQAWEAAFTNDPDQQYTMETGLDGFTVRTALPPEAGQVVAWLQGLIPRAGPGSAEQALADMGSKAYWILQRHQDVIGIAGWNTDQWIARVDPVYLDMLHANREILAALINVIDRVALDCQCDAAWVDVSPGLESLRTELQAAGFLVAEPGAHHYHLGQDAAGFMNLKNGHLLFKRLTQPDLFQAA